MAVLFVLLLNQICFWYSKLIFETHHTHGVDIFIGDI